MQKVPKSRTRTPNNREQLAAADFNAAFICNLHPWERTQRLHWADMYELTLVVFILELGSASSTDNKCDFFFCVPIHKIGLYIQSLAKVFVIQNY